MTRWKGRAGSRGIGSLAGKLHQRQVPAKSGRRCRRQAKPGSGEARRYLCLSESRRKDKLARSCPCFVNSPFPLLLPAPGHRSPCRLQEEPLELSQQLRSDSIPGRDAPGYAVSPASS